jgi:hypothetical protein
MMRIVSDEVLGSDLAADRVWTDWVATLSRTAKNVLSANDRDRLKDIVAHELERATQPEIEVIEEQ